MDPTTDDRAPDPTTPRRRASGFTVLGLVCMVASGVGLGLVVGSDDGWHGGPVPVLTAGLVVALFAAEIRPPRWLTFGGVSVSLSWVCAFAVVLAGAPAVALVAIAAAGVVSGAVARADVTVTLFNVGQVATSLAVGIGVLRWTGRAEALADGSTIDGAWVLGVLAASAATYVANAVLVSFGAHLRHGVPVPSTVQAALRANLLGDGVLIALAPVIVAVGLRSLWLVIFAVLTAVGVTMISRIASVSIHDAAHDDLTGLLNRRGVTEELERRIESAAEAVGERLVVALVDLDGFKPVNDRLGHAAGDQVLVEVAARLRAEAPADAVVGRLGGDEFVVAWRAPVDEDPRGPAGRLVDALGVPVRIGAEALVVGGSVGVSFAGADVAAALARADAAMYGAKTARSGVAIAGARPGSGT